MLQLRIASVAWNANAKAPEAATVFLKRHLHSTQMQLVRRKTRRAEQRFLEKPQASSS